MFHLFALTVLAGGATPARETLRENGGLPAPPHPPFTIRPASPGPSHSRATGAAPEGPPYSNQLGRIADTHSRCWLKGFARRRPAPSVSPTPHTTGTQQGGSTLDSGGLCRRCGAHLLSSGGDAAWINTCGGSNELGCGRKRRMASSAFGNSRITQAQSALNRAQLLSHID
jgi:hypothetical protein